jgi:hypothetical protein
VAQAVHGDCPAELANVPEAHAAHTRSDVAVAALLVYRPAGHGLRTAAHAPPLSSPENVEPTAHGVQTRFAVAEPAADMQKPAPHVRHVAHASLPAAALKAPAAHAVHVRSLDSVAALFMYLPAAHAPRICAGRGGGEGECAVQEASAVPVWKPTVVPKSTVAPPEHEHSAVVRAEAVAVSAARTTIEAVFIV